MRCTGRVTPREIIEKQSANLLCSVVVSLASRLGQKLGVFRPPLQKSGIVDELLIASGPQRRLSAD
jgi:hypothetical protein